MFSPMLIAGKDAININVAKGFQNKCILRKSLIPPIISSVDMSNTRVLYTGKGFFHWAHIYLTCSFLACSITFWLCLGDLDDHSCFYLFTFPHLALSHGMSLPVQLDVVG